MYQKQILNIQNSKIQPVFTFSKRSPAIVFVTFSKLKWFIIDVLLVLIIFGSLPSGVHAKLTIIKECGEIVCKPHNYCSKADHSCRPCHEVCDPLVGNYDKNVCEKDCQDYLHDLWYMRKPENESSTGGQDEFYIDLYYKMEQDLRLLKILIGVVIILSTVVMLALFAIMIYFKRLRNRLHLQSLNSNGTLHLKKSKKRISDFPVIYSNSKVLSLPFPETGPPSHISSSINNNMSRGSSPDLVSRTVNLTSPYSTTNTSRIGHKNDQKMTQQEKQSRFKKEPSESTLPEYHAYDNPGLVPSPVHNIHM